MKSFDWSSYIEKTQFIDPQAYFARGDQTPKIILDIIEKNLKKTKIKSILELGCSAGYYGKLIEERIGRKLYKAGVDNNRRIKKYDILDHYFVSDLFRFRSKEKFDLVFSLGLIEHFNKDDRARIFLKHLNLSTGKIIIGLPNVDYSLRFLGIKIYNDLLCGNRHFRVTRKEILSLAKTNELKILFEGYFANNFILQKFFKFKKRLGNRFFLDYYLIILEK